MKTFAKKYLVDISEVANSNSSASSTNNRNKRQRRDIRDLPQSSNFIFMSDDDHGNIFESLQEKRSSTTRSKRLTYEDMDRILLTLDVTQKKKKVVNHENEESIIVKSEPVEQEQLVITHVVEAKDEPVEINVIPTGPMEFGTPEFTGVLDNYVQNIHRSCTTNVSIVTPPPTSSRPKRIRKRKRLSIEESEPVVRPKRIRKKRQPTPPIPMLTDAEIEQQFGERLSPVIKSEENVEQIQMDIENVPQTPIEKARAKLTHALERGSGPDRFLLKIRSRESRLIEIELAIYGTADWHAQRTRILSKIEEALRGLRVSWNKIDIRVDDFDVQICTSPHATTQPTPITQNNSNSSWFLKTLSESGPLIVHIHDRRRPHQRYLVKCPCPHCSPTSETSLPVIVSVSPAKQSAHRLSPPSILRRPMPNIASLYNIHTRFFQDLIHQYGTNTISSVTQCVLDLSLIVSVHSSLEELVESKENYQLKYQQIIDPLKFTEQRMITKGYQTPEILKFYKLIQQNKANIRNAQSMRNVIFSNVLKSRPMVINKRSRQSFSINDQAKAHFTPIIELKPILGSNESSLKTTTTTTSTTNNDSIRKVTKIISTNTLQKDSPCINTITTQEITPRVIRLLTSNSIRLVTPSTTNPLVPKQINVVKPLSSISSTVKLTNPILISNKSLK